VKFFSGPEYVEDDWSATAECGTSAKAHTQDARYK
jgi:hypothetical protein